MHAVHFQGPDFSHVAHPDVYLFDKDNDSDYIAPISDEST